jgi:hypothetical protein
MQWGPDSHQGAGMAEVGHAVLVDVRRDIGEWGSTRWVASCGPGWGAEPSG